MAEEFHKSCAEHFDVDGVEIGRGHERVVGAHQVLVIAQRKTEFEERDVVTQVTVHTQQPRPEHKLYLLPSSYGLKHN